MSVMIWLIFGMGHILIIPLDYFCYFVDMTIIENFEFRIIGLSDI